MNHEKRSISIGMTPSALSSSSNLSNTTANTNNNNNTNTILHRQVTASTSNLASTNLLFNLNRQRNATFSNFQNTANPTTNLSSQANASFTNHNTANNASFSANPNLSSQASFTTNVTALLKYQQQQQQQNQQLLSQSLSNIASAMTTSNDNNNNGISNAIFAMFGDTKNTNNNNNIAGSAALNSTTATTPSTANPLIQAFQQGIVQQQQWNNTTTNSNAVTNSNDGSTSNNNNIQFVSLLNQPTLPATLSKNYSNNNSIVGNNNANSSNGGNSALRNATFLNMQQSMQPPQQQQQLSAGTTNVIGNNNAKNDGLTDSLLQEAMQRASRVGTSTAFSNNNLNTNNIVQMMQQQAQEQQQQQQSLQQQQQTGNYVNQQPFAAFQLQSGQLVNQPGTTVTTTSSRLSLTSSSSSSSPNLMPMQHQLQPTGQNNNDPINVNAFSFGSNGMNSMTKQGMNTEPSFTNTSTTGNGKDKNVDSNNAGGNKLSEQINTTFSINKNQQQQQQHQQQQNSPRSNKNVNNLFMNEQFNKMPTSNAKLFNDGTSATYNANASKNSPTMTGQSVNLSANYIKTATNNGNIMSLSTDNINNIYPNATVQNMTGGSNNDGVNTQQESPFMNDGGSNNADEAIMSMQDEDDMEAKLDRLDQLLTESIQNERNDNAGVRDDQYGGPRSISSIFNDVLGTNSGKTNHFDKDDNNNRQNNMFGAQSCPNLLGNSKNKRARIAVPTSMKNQTFNRPVRRSGLQTLVEHDESTSSMLDGADVDFSSKSTMMNIEVKRTSDSNSNDPSSNEISSVRNTYNSGLPDDDVLASYFENYDLEPLDSYNSLRGGDGEGLTPLLESFAADDFRCMTPLNLSSTSWGAQSCPNMGQPQQHNVYKPSKRGIGTSKLESHYENEEWRNNETNDVKMQQDPIATRSSAVVGCGRPNDLLARLNERRTGQQQQRVNDSSGNSSMTTSSPGSNRSSMMACGKPNDLLSRMSNKRQLSSSASNQFTGVSSVATSSSTACGKPNDLLARLSAKRTLNNITTSKPLSALHVKAEGVDDTGSLALEGNSTASGTTSSLVEGNPAAGCNIEAGTDYGDYCKSEEAWSKRISQINSNSFEEKKNQYQMQQQLGLGDAAALMRDDADDDDNTVMSFSQFTSDFSLPNDFDDTTLLGEIDPDLTFT